MRPGSLIRRCAGAVAVALLSACGAASSTESDTAAVTVLPGGATSAIDATSVAEPVASPLASTLASPLASPVAPSAIGSSSIATIGSSAAASLPATRVTQPPGTTCERIAAAVGARHPATDQLVIVRAATSSDTTAVLQIVDRTGSGWRCGDERTARVGRAGVRPLADRRSGDDTTPAGVFPLGTMTAWDGQVFSFFGNLPDPGVSNATGGYRPVRTGDCFGATPNTAGYGHLRRDTSCPGPDDEYLPSIGAYTTAALIGANMEPDVSGDAPGEIPYAAAIFLHRFTFVSGTTGATKATSGCVSLAQGDLSDVLQLLRPGVLFAIGTTDSLLAGG